jgi:nucleotide-binding universal stress UspA family protein
MYDRILLPTDGSAGTRTTIDHATSLAQDNDATVYVLYVVDRRLSLAAADDAENDVMESLERDGQRALERVGSALDEAGAEYETALREAVPHRGILSHAREKDVDVIVMGTHGKTGRDRLGNIGSVTQRVLDSEQWPVLVINVGGD